jgi:4-hydroxybenzoate polyprenyltransferase
VEFVLNQVNKSEIKACFRAMRPYHIAKNFLLFSPLFLGYQSVNSVVLKHIFLGFLVFCFLASSSYLINDLLDLENDKQHFRKQKRPFATGELPLGVGIILAPCLSIFALLLAFYLPLNFLIAAISYYLLALLYSFFIKQKKWLDVILLAVLYSLRVFAGMAALEEGFSLWLIFSALFLFFSLALLKRYAELHTMQLENKVFLLGRAYQLTDKNKLIVLGHLSGYLSILVFIIYIYSVKVGFFYESPLLLWLICPCLFIWLKHIWHLAEQGKICDDPVVFTVTDSYSWIILALIITIALLATWIPFSFN